MYIIPYQNHTQAFVAPAFGFFGPERVGADGLVYPPDPEDVPGDMVRGYIHIYIYVCVVSGYRCMHNMKRLGRDIHTT